MNEINDVTEVDCFYCAEKINSKAKKCKHCGEILDTTLRELEILKSHKKDIYVTNNAASSATATTVIPGDAAPITAKRPTKMANWALGTSIVCFLNALILTANDELTTNHAVGQSIIGLVPITLGLIVLNSDRPGRKKAGWAIAIALISAISVFGNAN